MLIPNKREFLARRLRDVGIVSLLERAARRPCLLVVNYHRIGEKAGNPFHDPLVSAAPDVFRSHVQYLRGHFRLLGLDQVLDIAEDGFPLDEPSALITFDDGYRDNFDAALPILQSLGVPAAFFIPTGFFVRPRLPWWDHVAYLVKHSTKEHLQLSLPVPLTIDLRRVSRATAVDTIADAFSRVDPEEERRCLDHLEKAAGVEVDTEALGRALFMTWDQVRRLAEAGMGIGSHAHDHPKLARLSEAEQSRELAESRRILQSELGREVATIAYPFGTADACDARTRRLARAAGYRLGFAMRRVVNRPGRTDPLDIARFNVAFPDTAALFRARAVLYASLGFSIV